MNKVTPTILDKAIGWFSPATATARLKARAVNQWFEAANITRHRSWMPVRAQDSQFTATPWARTVCMSHARYLFDNVGFVRGSLERLSDLAAGSRGPVAQSLSSDQAFNDAATRYFSEWGKYCDYYQKLQWADVCYLAVLSMLRDGDMGCILAESASGIPKLQIVEGHRIGNSYNLSKEEDVDGVMLNSLGQPTAYKIAVSGELYTNQVETIQVAAKDFLLFQDFQRADALRGISALAHAINNLRDISDILAAEKDGVKYNSSQGAFVTTLTGEADPTDWDPAVSNLTSPDDVTTLKLEDVYSGNIKRLNPGEKVDLLKSDRPNPTFQGFLDYLARDVASGLQLPLEFIWNSTQANGANQRFITAVAQRKIDRLQNLLIRRFCNRIYGWVIAKAAKNGDIPPLPDDWFKVRWQPSSARITVDAGREARENRADWQCGLRTLQEDLSERGIDPDQHLEQRGREAAKAVEVAKKYNIPLWMVWQGTANGNPLDPEDQAEQANAIKTDRPETGEKPVEGEEDV